MTMNKSVSIVIPIFNEEEILEQTVLDLVKTIEQEFEEFEIILSENGSRDRTREIVDDLVKRDERIIGLTDEEVADYGLALIEGINTAKFDEICILELDYLDLGFMRNSYQMLDRFDLIVGSKKISPGIDRRPIERRFMSSGYNGLLKIFFKLPLSETHGLKTLRKSRLLDITNNCVSRHAVYPSEFVLRACRDKDLKVCEIPLTMPLEEIRTTRINASKRLKKTLDDLRLLHRVLRK